MWFTNANYTDQVVKPEKLSAKFKTAQIASEFREVFERCKAELLSSVEGGRGKDGEEEETEEERGREKGGKEGSEEEDIEDSVETASSSQVSEAV